MAFSSFSGELHFVLVSDGNQKRVKVQDEDGSEKFLEEHIADVMGFPNENELDHQISQLRSGQDSPIERNVGKVNVSFYRNL